MRAFSKLDTGVAPHDQRHIDERLSNLIYKDDQPAPTQAINYAPPQVREQAQSAAIPLLSRIEQLCLLCRELTYSEMMEFAESIKADPAVIHAWAKGYPND